MPSAEIKAVAKAETEDFEIVQSGIKIKDLGGMTPEIIVVAARIPGHGLVARHVRDATANNGEMRFFWRWNPGLVGGLGDSLGGTFDGLSALHSRVERSQGYRGYSRTEEQNEVREFISKQPHVSRIMKLADHLPKPVFDMGDAQSPRPGPNSQHVPEWFRWFDRHQTGDFGDFGAFQDRPLTEAEKWAPSLFGHAVENIHAIQNRTGCVQSRYPVGGLGNDKVHVLTAFSTGRGLPTRTICWIS